MTICSWFEEKRRAVRATWWAIYDQRNSDCNLQFGGYMRDKGVGR